MFPAAVFAEDKFEDRENKALNPIESEEAPKS
jgi:hypothetical protein